MFRTLLLGVPVACIALAVSLVYMAARAPRTFASHWSSPRVVVSQGTDGVFAPVMSPDQRWHVLAINSNIHALVYQPASGSLGENPPASILDRGDVLDLSLCRSGSSEMAAWIHNYNGSTSLMAAMLRPGTQQWTVFPLLRSVQPIEHPYLFQGSGGRFNLVFSWQGTGNFDVYLMSFLSGERKPTVFRRLTHAQYYAFLPRAVTDSRGIIDLVHLDSCCRQTIWREELDRYDSRGRRVKPTQILGSFDLGSSAQIPTEWPETIIRTPAGQIWGSFSDTRGLLVFALRPNGESLFAPHVVAAPDSTPPSVALAVGSDSAYLFWESRFDLGSYLTALRLDRTGTPQGSAERMAYEGASETQPHAAMVNDVPNVIYQASPSKGPPTLRTLDFRKSVKPSLQQRLGLGIGNPWTDVALLLVGSVGLAVVTTVGNILTVFGLALAGILTVRVLRRVPGRWSWYALLLSLGLYLIFVSPGGPILFIDTTTSMGFSPVPYGLIAACGALGIIGWIGLVGLRHMEDFFRASIMALIGVYFFAFLEAVVFIQQRLAYI